MFQLRHVFCHSTQSHVGVRQDGSGQGGGIAAIICMGFDEGGVLATFMAKELALDFKTEADFMGYDSPRISVDCVSFSIPDVANDRYWKEFDSLVDTKVHVRHTSDAKRSTKLPESCLVVGNDRGSFHWKFQQKVAKQNVTCDRLVEEIDNNIHVS